MLIFYLSLIEDKENRLIFERIYYKYKDDVLRTTRYWMQDYHEGEDAAQDTWVYISKNISRLRVCDDIAIKSYILSVAKSCCVDQLRKRPDKMSVISMADFLEEPIEIEKDVDEDLLFREVCAREASRELFECLRALNESDREILKFRYFHGRKVREIASDLHIEVNATKQRLARARTRLSEKLKEKDLFHEDKFIEF